MTPNALYIIAVSALMFSLLPGCQNSNVRVIKGEEQIGAAPVGSLFATSVATIVHVDKFERLVTLSHAKSLKEYTFLESHDMKGNKTAILKTRINRTNSLRTADILEGAPKINDKVIAAGPEASERLREIYRDPIGG